MPLAMNVRIALVGVATRGSPRRLKLVLSKTGTPVAPQIRV